MSERTSYEPGTPSWVDLATPDPAAAKEFYGALFGWEAADAGPPEETGGYAMFTLRGKNVAGVVQLMSPQQPPMWSTYVSTDDADAVVARAKDAGGQPIVEPMDITDVGRMAYVMHPAAGAIGVWQPQRHKGADLVNEPGAFTWSTLHTRDQDGAAGFYEAVFGWTLQDFGGTLVFNAGERGVANMLDMPPGTPDQVPPFWMTIFATADTDATAAQAKERGGQVVAEPFDIPDVGRYAVIADPQGVAFGVITAPPEGM
jgi:predicted enzyme related to lactoylglutathione lyase